MMRKKIRQKAAGIAVCLLMVFSLVLPPKAFAISIPDEQKLAREFMKMIQKQKGILKDPVAGHLIDTVGRNILAQIPPQPFEYTFYLVDDPTFNAFAAPAANIFIHTGLIMALDTVDELAGIMGHEVAHAASRHVSQSIDRNKLVSIGSMAGLLAGVLIGAAGGGDAGQAVSIGAMAAGQSSMLAFTRENETEADQKALLFLKQTCYSPRGLLTSLEKIRAADYRGVEGIPDYFKTHPGTGKRIAHVSGLLADYTPPGNKAACPKTYDYDMVKYRLLGLYADKDKAEKEMEKTLAAEPSGPAPYYGMGLLQARKFRRQEAVSLLQQALAFDLFNPLVLVELARIHAEEGRFAKATGILSGLTNEPVIGPSARYHLAVAQLESGDLPKARKNLEQVILDLPDTFPRAYYHLAGILSRQDKKALSHYYLGVYYFQEKNMKNAAHHYKRALDLGLEDNRRKQAAQEQLKEMGLRPSPEKPS